MKKAYVLFTLFAFVLVVAGSLFAAAPDSAVLKAKNGNITFPHKKHAEEMKLPCVTCHHGLKEGTVPDKKCNDCHGVDAKAPKAQDAFHKTCQGCHKTENEKNAKKAPTKCTECHNK